MQSKDSVLQPVLNDRTLIALMRLRFIPLKFVQQRCGIKSTRKAIIQLIKEFESIKNAPDVQGEGYVTSFVEAKPQFQIIKKSIHVSIGLDATKSSAAVLTANELIDAISKKTLLVDSTNPKVTAEFKRDVYIPLEKQLENYERILAECDRSLNLDTALDRTNTDVTTWRRLKSNMARHGLSKEIRFAKNVLIHGELCAQVEKKYFGRKIPDVINELVRQSLQD